jgi:hypothetical protein
MPPKGAIRFSPAPPSFPEASTKRSYAHLNECRYGARSRKNVEARHTDDSKATRLLNDSMMVP